ncbi:MAG: nuclear transport factor 2 family protein [Acidobacteriota bacterium]
MTRMLSVLLSAAFLLPLAAQPAEDPTHQQLRGLKTTMEKALNERDLDTIVANVDPNVVFTTMNGDVCRGPEQIRAYFHKMLTSPGHIVKDVKVSFEVDALTTLYGGDTGVAYGSSKDHYELTNGSTFDIQGRWTCTMVRNGDRWVIAAFHYSANIFENPLLERLKRVIWTVGIVCGFLGLVIGVFAGRILARRKTVA